MTKAELLENLLSRDFIGWVGAPDLLETKPDSTNSYIVNVREESALVAIYRNISFYVVDETGAGEKAFYKDADIKRSLPNAQFKDFVQANFKEIMPSIMDFTWVSIDEEKKSGVIKCVIPDDAVSGEFTVKGFLVADNAGILVMLPMSLSADIAVGVNSI